MHEQYRRTTPATILRLMFGEQEMAEGETLSLTLELPRSLDERTGTATTSVPGSSRA